MKTVSSGEASAFILSSRITVPATAWSCEGEAVAGAVFESSLADEASSAFAPSAAFLWEAVGETAEIESFTPPRRFASLMFA